MCDGSKSASVAFLLAIVVENERVWGRALPGVIRRTACLRAACAERRHTETRESPFCQARPAEGSGSTSRRSSGSNVDFMAIVGEDEALKLVRPRSVDIYSSSAKKDRNAEGRRLPTRRTSNQSDVITVFLYCKSPKRRPWYLLNIYNSINPQYHRR